MINATVIKKKIEFEKFLLARNPSERFVKTYFRYLNSAVVCNATRKVSSQINILSVTDMKQLEEIYREVKNNPNNIKYHNVYSGAISAYIKFLNGTPLRKAVVKNPTTRNQNKKT